MLAWPKRRVEIKHIHGSHGGSLRRKSPPNRRTRRGPRDSRAVSIASQLAEAAAGFARG